MMSNRWVRALRMEPAVYREVAFDRAASGQAAAILAAAVLIHLAAARMQQWPSGLALPWVLSWLAGSALIYLPAARLSGRGGSLGMTFRILAFAYLPTIVGLAALALLTMASLAHPFWAVLAIPMLVGVVAWAVRAAVAGVGELCHLGLGRALAVAVLAGLALAVAVNLALCSLNLLALR
jgi:hypothetical protein